MQGFKHRPVGSERCYFMCTVPLDTEVDVILRYKNNNAVMTYSIMFLAVTDL